jgi:hypothetical protein
MAQFLRYRGGSGDAVCAHISQDGHRFLMIKQAGADQTAASPQIIVVQNWFEGLKRLVPVD